MLENINLIFLLYWVQVPLSASSNGPNAGDGQVQQTRWWHLMENTCKKNQKTMDLGPWQAHTGSGLS